MMEIPPGIAPHNGKELELMLSGSKPFALFTAEPNMTPEDVGDADFAPYVERGEILRFVHVDPETGIESRRYCLPNEEWRAKLSQLIWRMCLDGTVFQIFSSIDLYRLEGTLLGYSKESIEAFVARTSTLGEKSSGEALQPVESVPLSRKS